MNDFGTELTVLLDDVAESITPRSNFDAVAPGAVGVGPAGDTPGHGRPFRRTVAVAAASVFLLGGIAAAAYPRGDDADLVATSSSVTESPAIDRSPATTTGTKDGEAEIAPVDRPTAKPIAASEEPKPQPEPKPKPIVVYSAQLGESSREANRIEQVILGNAAPEERVLATTSYGSADAISDAEGHWRLFLVLEDVAHDEIATRVTFERSEKVFELVVETAAGPKTTLPPEPKPEPEPKPKPEPEPDPEPVEFTATMGNSSPAADPMKQVLYGTATPGSTVLATSAYGHATAVVGSKGGWELALKMYNVPAPSSVHITVTVNTGGPEFEFWVDRPAPEPEPEPETVAFTASVADTYHKAEYTKVVLRGTGQPGSGVLASSEHGTEDAGVDSKGRWEIYLKLWELPAGHETVVRVTNNGSEAVHEFVVEGPEPEPEPDPVEFTANAALTESDRTPPVNEYWGTITPGAKVKVVSDYGSVYVHANGEGFWDARVEFPDAPAGVTFTVVVWSPESEMSFEFPFTRIAPD